MGDGEPFSETIRHTDAGDFYLTHVVWHNSYGSNQPETGVRIMRDGKVVPNTFRLIEHGVRDFDFAEPLILRGLRKGWDTYRIGEFVKRLAKRKAPRSRSWVR